MASTLKVDTIAHTGGTTALTVDSSGRILQPNKPMASVTRAGDMAAHTGTAYPTLIFNQVDLDVGGHYNSGTGEFTCPVDGIYQVTCFGMDTNSGAAGAFYLRLEKNGVQYGALSGNYANAGSHQGSCGTWITSCTAGNTLEIGYYATSGVQGSYTGATFMLIG